MNEKQANCFSRDVLRAYKCPYCDGWHLTSEGALGDGRIRKKRKPEQKFERRRKRRFY